MTVIGYVYFQKRLCLIGGRIPLEDRAISNQKMVQKYEQKNGLLLGDRCVDWVACFNII